MAEQRRAMASEPKRLRVTMEAPYSGTSGTKKAKLGLVALQRAAVKVEPVDKGDNKADADQVMAVAVADSGPTVLGTTGKAATDVQDEPTAESQQLPTGQGTQQPNTPQDEDELKTETAHTAAFQNELGSLGDMHDTAGLSEQMTSDGFFEVI